MKASMMKKLLNVIVTLVAGVAMGAGADYAQRQALSLREISGVPKEVARYGAIELTLDLRATCDNPFDPEDIDVHAEFTSPAGKAVRVNGFLFQPFARRLQDGAERIEPAGEPVWKLRFTPDSTGNWSGKITAKDRTRSTSQAIPAFEVKDSPSPGFVRRGKSNPFGFAWENGKPFFPVGENMCWGGRRGSFDYDAWLPELSKAGGDYLRIWMCSWNCALEWSQDPKGDRRSGNYHGVGVYSLDNAWKLDTILDAAERNGISVMLCLGTYGEFKDGGYFNEGQWKANPYNQANGGPCGKPGDFWTNPTARKLYRQRLRYLAARYAHRTNLQSWEFWNESEAPAAWVKEMAACLKGTGDLHLPAADPYQHLVTTTYGNAEVWEIPEIDFTQTHSYGTGNIPDHATEIHREAQRHARFGKPHLMGEFGIDWRSPDSKYDAGGAGINLHNGLWASALSGDAGGAMLWWWDNYVHPKRVYAQFGAFRKFVDAVPWNAGKWQPLTISPAPESAAAAGGASEPAPLRGYGLVHERLAIAWLQNTRHQWKNGYEKKEILPVPPMEIVLRELPAGRYQVEWWDTSTGEVTRRETVQAASGELQLHTPELAEDVALKLVGESSL